MAKFQFGAPVWEQNDLQGGPLTCDINIDHSVPDCAERVEIHISFVPKSMKVYCKVQIWNGEIPLCELLIIEDARAFHVSFDRVTVVQDDDTVEVRYQKISQGASKTEQYATIIAHTLNQLRQGKPAHREFVQHLEQHGFRDGEEFEYKKIHSATTCSATQREGSLDLLASIFTRGMDNIMADNLHTWTSIKTSNCREAHRFDVERASVLDTLKLKMRGYEMGDGALDARSCPCGMPCSG